jgi:hypothetical protein
MVTPMRACSLPTKSDQENRNNRLKADWEKRQALHQKSGYGVSHRFDGTVGRAQRRGLEMRGGGVQRAGSGMASPSSRPSALRIMRLTKKK